MAREIKFRAWHEPSKTMFVDGFNLNLDGKFIEHEKEGVFHFTGINKVKLMQFTGLLDKNGKEIYEGDIIKEYWEPCGDDAVVSGEYIGEVFYEDAGYWTRSKNHHHAITESCESYEIIGNIYENPDLLKENEK